ncbi:hypothetical protein FOMPIDRAFT_1045065 [Fomitopsis schrenkii]|uniref:Uncharacterized protein n=1 Tax=Fomitopsis schrenkii TaxID=2126942 RepID=S8ENR8_FOMSC|nr:hypothetical protein FOMPIDRAFT_1045065 [Fomitopsis schrenkii]
MCDDEQVDDEVPGPGGDAEVENEEGRELERMEERDAQPENEEGRELERMEERDAQPENEEGSRTEQEADAKAENEEEGKRKGDLSGAEGIDDEEGRVVALKGGYEEGGTAGEYWAEGSDSEDDEDDREFTVEVRAISELLEPSLKGGSAVVERRSG